MGFDPTFLDMMPQTFGIKRFAGIRDVKGVPVYGDTDSVRGLLSGAKAGKMVRTRTGELIQATMVAELAGRLGENAMGEATAINPEDALVLPDGSEPSFWSATPYYDVDGAVHNVEVACA